MGKRISWITNSSSKTAPPLTEKMLKKYLFACEMCGRKDCPNQWRDERFCKPKSTPKQKSGGSK